MKDYKNYKETSQEELNTMIMNLLYVLDGKDVEEIISALREDLNFYSDLVRNKETLVKTKLQEVKNEIGQNFSDNYSSTFRSELVAVENGICYTKEIANASHKRKPSDGYSKRSIERVWNMLFL